MPEEKEPQSLSFPVFPIESYRSLFDFLSTADGYKAVGEASTSYFVIQHVPERILNEFGNDIRFVFILRDPAIRTLSAYLHMFKRDHERRDWNDLFSDLSYDEEEVINMEKKACVKAEIDGSIITEPYRASYGLYGLWPYRYLNGSLYSRHISRYLRLFGRQNCHFVTLEKLQVDPVSVIRGIYRFIGLRDNFVPNGISRTWNKTIVVNPPPPFRMHAELDNFFRQERECIADLVGSIPPEWE